VNTPTDQEERLVHAGPSTGPPPPQQETPRQKRKWERRPKIDVNAPVKPATAYVAFSNTVRAELDGKPFSEISKTSGERWALVPTGEKQILEREALKLRGQYRTALDKYKETKDYKEYEDYTRTFKRNKDKDRTGSFSMPVATMATTSKEPLPESSLSYTGQASFSGRTILDTGSSAQNDPYLSSSWPFDSWSSSLAAAAAPSFSPFQPTPAPTYSGDSSRNQIEFPSGQEADFSDQGRGQNVTLPSMATSISGGSAFPRTGFPSGALASANLPTPSAAFLPTQQSGPLPPPPMSLLPYSLSYNPRSREDTRHYEQTGDKPGPSPE